MAAILLFPLLLLIFLLCIWPLPRSLAHVPRSSQHARTRLGLSIEIFRAWRGEQKGGILAWVMAQPVRCHSRIAQVFLSPLSSTPSVVLQDFDEAQNIILKRQGEFDIPALRKSIFSGLIPESAVCYSSNDPKFKLVRELAGDTMSSSFLNNVTGPKIYKEIEKLVELAVLHAKQGQPWDTKKHIHVVLFNIMFSSGFGKDPRGKQFNKNFKRLSGPVLEAGVSLLEDTESREIYKASWNHNGKLLHSSWIQPQLFYWLNRFIPSWRNSSEIMNTIAEQREASFLDKIAKEKDASPSTEFEAILQRGIKRQGYPSTELKKIAFDEVYSHQLGGQADLAHVSTWAVKYLSLYRDEQYKIIQDLRAAYPEAWDQGRPPTISEITLTHGTRLPYLEAFLREVLRCRPALTFVLREAGQNTNILGYDIPKGIQICIPTFGPGLTEPYLHEQQQEEEKDIPTSHTGTPHWDDPEMFRPERWLRKNTDSGELEFYPQSGPFLTLGGGRRGCYGKPLVYLSLRIMITLLVWDFVFEELPQGLRYEDDLGRRPSVLPGYCYVKLTERFPLRTGKSG